MGEVDVVDLTPDNIEDYGVCGYKDIRKHQELRNKIAWFRRYYEKGLRIKAIVTSGGGYQGMIEYIPGRYSYRPVNAEDYMLIHCIFVGFKNEYKGRGLGSLLIDECMKDARSMGLGGVAVVTRKGPFMADKRIFLKKGFKAVDKAEPDFELLAVKFDGDLEDPGFRPCVREGTSKNQKDLTIMRSVQCPYTLKNVNAIMETAKRKYGMSPTLIDLDDPEDAQNAPCAFGSFCILHDGEVVAHHPISNKRFENIMDKRI